MSRRKRRGFTEREDAFILANRGRMTLRAMGEALGREHSSINKRYQVLTGETVGVWTRWELREGGVWWKVCPRCKEDYPRSCYYPSKYSKNGYRSYCKVCMGREHESYRIAHPQKVRSWRKAWAHRQREANRGNAA